MRCLCGFLSIAFVLLLTTGCGYIDNEHMVDMFFENGAIYTMDNFGTVAENMAIKDGKIIFLGTSDDGNKYKNNAKEVVDLVKKGNGITVIAHPDTIGWSNRELYFKIKSLQERGLSGIEIINKNTENNNVEYYAYLAEELGLIKTVGSDFHNPKEQDIGVAVEEDIYKEFIKKI